MSIIDDAKKRIKEIKLKEEVLANGLNIPFNFTNSGARKIMDIVHQKHALVLSEPDVPYIGTGYENKFGERSSSIISLDKDYNIIAKISKFSDPNLSNHIYYLILKSVDDTTIHVVERKPYRSKTEIYGYFMNNSVLDYHSYTGEPIRKGETIVKSGGFDKFMNKTNGRNALVAYMAMDDNMEDSVIISEECRYKFRAPFFHNIRRVINRNDIPLNIYGNDDVYKIFPDIGEYVNNGKLAMFRKEDKENAIYTQSIARLQETMVSDESIEVKGKVIDIDIYCNDPSILDNYYNGQLKKYYMDRHNMIDSIVKIVSPYLAQGYTFTSEMMKLFSDCTRELNGTPFVDKKGFDLCVDFTVMEELPLQVGDKISDRFGGKGVVSKIVPTEQMMKLPNGKYVDIYKNSSTMYGRENPGQIFEYEINYISSCILDYIYNSGLSVHSAYNLILRFLSIVSPEEKDSMIKATSSMDDYDLMMFVSSIMSYDCIHISTDPMSARMDIDLIDQLYKEFPMAKKVHTQVPVKDSNGNIRMVDTKRPMIAGYQYCFRLKQIAEEKFSVTSLSSTNIKNENAKSKDSKNYRELYSSTPIRFGSMETGDFGHMGSDIVVMNMMQYSLSPNARLLAEQMYTGDPYNVDIKLDQTCSNRSVESLNARLKTMGYRIVFKKKKKEPIPLILQSLIRFLDNPVKELITVKKDIEAYKKTIKEIEEIDKRNLITVKLITFLGDRDRKEK